MNFASANLLPFNSLNFLENMHSILLALSHVYCGGCHSTNNTKKSLCRNKQQLSKCSKISYPVTLALFHGVTRTPPLSKRYCHGLSYHVTNHGGPQLLLASCLIPLTFDFLWLPAVLRTCSLSGLCRAVGTCHIPLFCQRNDFLFSHLSPTSPGDLTKSAAVSHTVVIDGHTLCLLVLCWGLWDPFSLQSLSPNPRVELETE